MILNLLATLAEIYVDDLSEITSRGKKQRASEGYYNGSIPFGYCNGLCNGCTDLNGKGYCPRVGQMPLGNGKVPVPHPIDRHAVQLAFEWYAGGKYSDADVAHLLNEYTLQLDGKTYKFRPKRPQLKNAHHRKYTVDRSFVKSSMREILRRSFYTGVVEYRGGTGIAENRKKYKTAQSVYPGLHEPIIVQSLYDRAMAVRRTRNKHPHPSNKNARVYPLSRILYSYPKGNRMRAVTNGSKQRLYRDRANIGKSKLDSASRSPQPNVDAIQVEQQVLAILSTLSIPQSWQEQIRAYLIAPERGLSEIERVRRDIAATAHRLRELYIAGDISKADYNSRKQELDTRLSKLLYPDNLDNPKVDGWLADLPALFSLATPVELKDLFESVFQEVYIRNEAVVCLIPHKPFINIFSTTDSQIEICTEIPDKMTA